MNRPQSRCRPGFLFGGRHGPIAQTSALLKRFPRPNRVHSDRTFLPVRYLSQRVPAFILWRPTGRRLLLPKLIGYLSRRSRWLANGWQEKALSSYAGIARRVSSLRTRGTYVIAR